MEESPKDPRSLSAPWDAESTQDIHFPKEGVGNLYKDVERNQHVEAGLAARPERDLREQKRFEELREEPWKLELAVLMALFARSNDICPDVWPYTKFDDQTSLENAPIPDDLTVADAIAIVSDDLQRLAPATENSLSWFARNIEAPMARRATQARFGATHLDDEQAGIWLRGRTTDVDLQAHTVTDMDIARAPGVIAGWLHEAESLLKQSEKSRTQAGELAEEAYGRLRWKIMALKTAQELARTIARDRQAWPDFGEWIRDISERSEWVTVETSAGAIQKLVVQVAADTGQMSPNSPGFLRHCDFAAALYVRALGIKVW